MPVVKFFRRLDLDQMDLFLDGHSLISRPASWRGPSVKPGCVADPVDHTDSVPRGSGELPAVTGNKCGVIELALLDIARCQQTRDRLGGRDPENHSEMVLWPQ